MRMADGERRPHGDNAPPLVFGIYPGMTGEELVNTGSVPDDPERTERALTLLQPAGRPFIVRSYVIYRGSGRSTNQTPADPVR
jgi:hypothetical protein